MAPQATEMGLFGAHPDDAELALGGYLAAKSATGSPCGIIDLSAGERGTRGDSATRLDEARAAARTLGLATRECLGLPDTRIEAGPDQREALATRLRALRPGLLVGHAADDPHPDHRAAAELTLAAWHLAGLGGTGLGGLPPHRAPLVMSFAPPRGAAPDLVVPIDATWDTKLAALRCHASQMAPGAHHRLGDHDPLREAEVRARALGSLIGCEFAEGLSLVGPTACRDPLQL